MTHCVISTNNKQSNNQKDFKNKFSAENYHEMDSGTKRNLLFSGLNMCAFQDVLRHPMFCFVHFKSRRRLCQNIIDTRTFISKHCWHKNDSIKQILAFICKHFNVCLWTGSRVILHPNQSCLSCFVIVKHTINLSIGSLLQWTYKVGIRFLMQCCMVLITLTKKGRVRRIT